MIASTMKAEPSPNPWVQAFTADVLESVAMVHASGSTADQKITSRLREELLGAVVRV
jgi:hypothetical protein